MKAVSHDLLIIFGRYPVPGKTKTRLITETGPVGAADVQRKLTEDIFQTATESASNNDIDIKFSFDNGSVYKVRQWLGPTAFFTSQANGDLGNRMFLAFKDAFNNGYRRVVLMGTDIHGVEGKDIENAFTALEKHDLVIAPSTDGGYWLMGMKKPVDIFRNITWSTEDVLTRTIDIAKKKGLDCVLLDEKIDIDTIDDLKKCCPGDTWHRPYISVVIPSYNEAKNIVSAVMSAKSDDAEIIVADGGSTDNTVAQARDAGARVVSSRKGRAVQQNHGAWAAKGRILVFLHADTLLPKDYAEYVFDTLIPRETAAGAFGFKTDFENKFMMIIEFMTNIRARFFQKPYGDQGIFLKKSLFDSVGGFLDVPIAEDLFLVRSLSKQGKIRIARADAVTSGRRWQKLGIARTTLINQVITAGCYMGFSPARLASLYSIKTK